MADRAVAVLTAGMRQPSSTALLAERLADATVRELTARGKSADLVTVELRPHAKALADAIVTGFPSPALAEVIEAVSGADGLIAVTPTFAASYAGLFKSFFDVLDRDALAGMPVLLAATGGSARHSLVIEYAMRPLLSYFRSVIVPTGVFAATEDFGDGPGVARLAARIDRAATELAELVATGTRRSAADPFAEPPSFADLLGDGGSQA
ncbi:MAG TPA: FMN reductase [Nakamurella sp.]|nr:FMN reductase [Nakamurella sp.]